MRTGVMTFTVAAFVAAFCGFRVPFTALAQAPRAVKSHDSPAMGCDFQRTAVRPRFGLLGEHTSTPPCITDREAFVTRHFATLSTAIPEPAQEEQSLVDRPHDVGRSPRPQSPHLVEALLLPEELRWAFDVRWRTENSLLVAAGKRGVVEIDLEGAVSATLFITGRGQGQLWMATRVGASDRLLVGAAPAFVVVFQFPGTSIPPLPRDYASTLDVDVRSDTALVLGARRDAAGRWAPDGAMAWIDDGRSDPKPVHYSESGPGSEIVSTCGPLDLGAVRFLEDGSFMVVPGVEGGAYLYSSEGRLLRSWQSLEIGIAGGCALDGDEGREVATSLESRWRYWNQNLIVEDVVSWRGSPALLVRRPSGGETRWELRILEVNAKPRTVRLPVASTSSRTRARIDVRGSRAAVLLHESGRLGVAPEFQPRILFLEMDK